MNGNSQKYQEYSFVSMDLGGYMLQSNFKYEHEGVLLSQE